MTCRLTVRTRTGLYFGLIAYKGADRKMRAFPTAGDRAEKNTAMYVGNDLASIRSQIEIDGDSVVRSDPIKN
jgi:hypothetical protein